MSTCRTTGIEYNNPNVCIKYSGSTYACVCEPCMEESREIGRRYLENPEAFIAEKRRQWLARQPFYYKWWIAFRGDDTKSKVE